MKRNFDYMDTKYKIKFKKKTGCLPFLPGSIRVPRQGGREQRPRFRERAGEMMGDEAEGGEGALRFLHPRHNRSRFGGGGGGQSK